MFTFRSVTVTVQVLPKSRIQVDRVSQQQQQQLNKDMSTNFSSKVSFVSKISTIMKATADNDTPIPGYLLPEISNLTFESMETCESCLDFLVDRLKSDSTHVKLKVLKLMKYIVENGHENFRMGLLKKSHGIAEATKFNGPPDPLHGNTPYIMVRKTAKALSEMLFNSETSGQLPSVDSVQKPKISSMGIGSSNSLQSGNTSRMEGFGNTASQVSNKSVGDVIKDGLFKMAEKLENTGSFHQREVLGSIESASNYTPPTDLSGKYFQSTHTTRLSQVIQTRPANRPKHVPGRAGGGWEDSDDDDDDSEIHSQSKSTGSNVLDVEERLQNVQDEDFNTEQNLVQSYLSKSESRMPTRCQLKNFVKESSGLNCDRIVEVLRNNLSASTNSHTTMTLLLLLEFLMASDLVNLERLTLVCCDVLVNSYNTETGPPQSKARKLIRILEKLTSHQSILPVKDQRDTLTDSLCTE